MTAQVLNIAADDVRVVLELDLDSSSFRLVGVLEGVGVDHELALLAKEAEKRIRFPVSVRHGSYGGRARFRSTFCVQA